MTGFETAGVPKHDPCVRKAVTWLKSKQRADGGWGEDNYSYYDTRMRGQFHTSTAFHTALALLALVNQTTLKSKPG